MDKKIVMLAGRGASTPILYNALNNEFGITRVILEEKEDRKTFLKRRIRKLGYFRVAGQMMFQLVVPPLLRRLSAKRRAGILNRYELDTTAIPEEKIVHVHSVNEEKVVALLQQMQPDLVIINGTRIISKKILQAVQCRFINVHAGITPKYRGVHGCYWALTKKDSDNSGVTVHFVDSGVDTGNVIFQTCVKPAAADNFTTYPLLQLAEGIRLLKKAVREYFDGTIIETQASGESRLWYHPTIWQYIYYRIVKGVK